MTSTQHTPPRFHPHRTYLARRYGTENTDPHNLGLDGGRADLIQEILAVTIVVLSSYKANNLTLDRHFRGRVCVATLLEREGRKCPRGCALRSTTPSATARVTALSGPRMSPLMEPTLPVRAPRRQRLRLGIALLMTGRKS